MRKLLITATLLIPTLFGVGYVVGQIRGPTASSAAGMVTTPTVTSSQTSSCTHGRFSALGKHADGTVTAVNGNTITVKPDADTGNPNEYTAVTTIVLTGSTQYNTSAGKSAITVGSYILASGTISADGKTLTASRVVVLPNGTRGYRPLFFTRGYRPLFFTPNGGVGPSL